MGSLGKDYHSFKRRFNSNNFQTLVLDSVTYVLEQ